MRLRRAAPADAKRLWRWRNDPAARAASFSPARIPLAAHRRWLAGKLSDPGCDLYVVTLAGRAMAQVRFDRRPRGAVVSLSLDGKYRGRGLGARVIALASRAYVKKRPGPVHAYVKPGNAASSAAFLKAGYRARGAARVQRQRCIHFVFGRKA